MALREQILRGAATLKPFAMAGLIVAVAVVAILLVPARGAAAIIGVLLGIVFTSLFFFRMALGSQIALFWAVAAITADAAYAKLNDLAPVTLASVLVKTVDAVIKIADPLIMGLGLSASDPRAKVSAVAPDFVWAFILSFVAIVGVHFVLRERGRGR